MNRGFPKSKPFCFWGLDYWFLNSSKCGDVFTNSLTNFRCVLICCSSLSVNFVDPHRRYVFFIDLASLCRESSAALPFNQWRRRFVPLFLIASCLKSVGLSKFTDGLILGQLGLFSRPFWELTPDQRSTPGLLWYLCSRHHLIGGFARSLHSPSSVLTIPANDSESLSNTPILSKETPLCSPSTSIGLWVLTNELVLGRWDYLDRLSWKLTIYKEVDAWTTVVSISSFSSDFPRSVHRNCPGPALTAPYPQWSGRLLAVVFECYHQQTDHCTYLPSFPSASSC